MCCTIDLKLFNTRYNSCVLDYKINPTLPSFCSIPRKLGIREKKNCPYWVEPPKDEPCG